MAVVGWLLAIGTVWGITNALLKRGALIADEAKRAAAEAQKQSGSRRSMVASFLGDWIRLLCVWQYSLPFLLNLSMSVLFVIKLGDSPITLAVPVTNATTFAVTAVAGAALGEKMRPLETLIGVALIVAGVTLCISPPITALS
jgi:multidrug transporter EmrE-like cation transporter